MSKVVKIVAMVAVAAALIVFAAPIAGALGIASITAGTIAAAGVGMAISAAMAIATSLFVKPPSISQSMADRLNSSINPTAPRKIVFGRTAAGNDIRFFEEHDLPSTKKDGYSQIVALASHRIHALRAWYVEEQLTWSGAISGKYAGGVRAFRPVLEGSSANAAPLGTGQYWTSTASFTGCAYAAITFKLDGEIWESGLPSKTTFVVDGCPLYDARRDSTNGGSGPHRIADQATWAFYDGGVELGRNPALALATYLIGYRINGKLVWGMGVPVERIDWDNIRDYANLCEERVALQDGSTVQRYTADGSFSTADSHETVILALTAAMGSCKLTDVGGRYTIIGGYDDTLGPTVDFTADHIVAAPGSPAPYSWVPVPPARETYNIARGRFADPNNQFQLSDWGAIETDPLNDGVPRTMTIDLGLVSRAETCQRIAKQFLLREAKTPGMFSATFGPLAFAATVGSLVTLSLPQEGWNRKLFRVLEQTENHDLLFQMVLREESSEVYAWDREEKPLPASIRPPGYDPSATIAPENVAVSSQTIKGADGFPISEITVTWTSEESGRVRGVQIESKPSTTSSWTEQAAGHSASAGTFTFMSNVPAAIINVRLRYRMDSGVYSAWSTHDVDASSAFIDWDSNVIVGDGKPADNATVGAPDGTMVGGKPAEAVVDAIVGNDGQIIRNRDLAADIAAAEQIASDLQATYGSTVSAAASADAAAQHQANAQAAANNAATAKTDAETAFAAAQAAAGNSEAARAAAETAKAAAELARGQSQAFAGNSEASRSASEAAKAVSEQARDQAQQAATNASGSAQAAAGNASNASIKADEAGEHASAAQASQVSAKSHADAAASSQSVAAISEGKASQSASASEQSATHASTAEGNAWQHREAANQYRSDAETFRNQASQSETNASGSVATAQQQAGLAAGSANQAGQSAGAAAGAASTASSKATEASQSASAALASSVSASTAAQSLMPATFGDARNWSNDWGTANGDISTDTRFNAYDHPTYGRILDVYNVPHFSPHIVPKGRIALVRDKVYRITVKWALTSGQAGSSVGATIFAIGIRPNSAATGDYWNSNNSAVSISEGQIGWGSFWATHSIDVHSNGLIDNGCQWTRPLFRLDSQGNYAVQSIEIRDITGEYHAAGSASAAAGSESAAAIYKGQAEQSASAANTSRTNAATSEGNAWQHREAANQYRSDAQTFRNEASQSKTDAAGSAATAVQQANLAAGSANQAGGSASAAAGSASGAASSASQAGQSASAAQQAEVSATTAAQAMMPSTFRTMKDWTWDYRTGTGDLSPDTRWIAYDHGTLGRIVQIANNPAFSPHTAPKGRVSLIRDHVYRITVKWLLAGQQENDTTRHAAIFAIGIRPDETDWNNINMGVTISPGDAGWGNAWASHYIDVDSNTLLDQGCAWVRPLFRLDSQGVFQVQCIEIRDITGESNAAGSANAAAGSASTASIKASEAGQSASSANTSQTNASTNEYNSWLNRQAAAGHENAAWDHRVGSAGHESAAQTFRNEASQSRSDAAGSASTASQQAGLASNSASQAGGSASAAAGSASTASSKASEAQQSASAASSSQVTASNAAAGAQQQFANTFPNFVGPIGKAAYDYVGDNSAGFSFENGPGQGWPQPYITAQQPGQGGTNNRITFKESVGIVVGRRYRVTGWFYNHGSNCANVSIWLLLTNNNQWDGNATGHGGDAVAPDCVNGVPLNQGGFWKIGIDFTVPGHWPSKWKPIFEFTTTGGAPNGLWHMSGLTISDITSEKAAADSASAASSAYSNAQYEAGQAGQSASSASGHANTASIKANEASGSASAAAGSASWANDRASAAAASATLSATYSTGGGNIIQETEFATSSVGWNFYSPFDNNWFTFARDHSEDGWRPHNLHNLGIRQANGDTSAWSQWHSDQISVTGSTWYEFSALTAAHRSNNYIRVDWLDANGTGISSNYTTSNTGSHGGGPNINSWLRVWGKAQSPANAARAHVVFVKDPTWSGQSDSYGWFCRPMLRQTYAEANGPSPYSPGSGALTAAAQQASISTNQTAIATANSSLANLTTIVQSGSPNLLKNGGFQQSMNYWSATHGGWNPHVSGGWGQITDRGGDWSGDHCYMDSERMPIFSGAIYTLSADSLYYLHGGSGHCYTEIVWYDGAGNWITQNSGNTYNASHDYSVNGAGRTIHKLTASAPGNATHAAARLVHYKAPGSSVNIIGWRQVKFEQGNVMTPYSNEAAVTTIAETVTSVDGKVNTALARAAVRLDVNGYVSGWEMNNNGQTGNMVINADHFAIQRPGGGPRTEYSSGRWMSTDGGSWMTVWGAPFGSGNRFMRWSGPYFGDLNQCNEGNAKEYLRVDGSMFFGGALLAGTLRNSSASSSLAANASTTTGEFGSNGGTITVNASWVYQYQVTGAYPATLQGRNDYDAAISAFGAASSSDGGHSHQGSKADGLNGSQIVLNLRKGGGLVASQASGTRITSLEGNRPTIGDSGGSIVWTYSHSSSFTHTDDQHAAVNRVFSVDVSRNLGSGSNVSQRVSVTTVE